MVKTKNLMQILNNSTKQIIGSIKMENNLVVRETKLIQMINKLTAKMNKKLATKAITKPLTIKIIKTPLIQR